MDEQQFNILLDKLNRNEKQIEKIIILLFGTDKDKGLYERMRNLEVFYRIPLIVSFLVNLALGIKILIG